MIFEYEGAIRNLAARCRFIHYVNSDLSAVGYYLL